MSQDIIVSPSRELYDLKRAYQMLQIEREGVYMGFGTTDTKHTKKTCSVRDDGFAKIRARINDLEKIA